MNINKKIGTSLGPLTEAHHGRRSSLWRLILGSALVLSACGASDAAPKETDKQAAAGQLRRYAVAGIMPGMTADKVKAAAQQAGYRLSNQSDGMDWQLQLQQATSGKKFSFGAPMKGVADQEFTKGGERISVSYLAMPQGSVAYSVHYSAAPGLLEFSKAVGELTRRYGKSSFSNNVAHPWAQWCSRPARSASECLTSSYMNVGDEGSGVTIYTQDQGLRAEQKRLLLKTASAKATF